MVQESKIFKRYTKKPDRENQEIWDKIVKNMEMIEGAQFSNSFILLKILQEADELGEKGLNSTEISERLAVHTQGRIFKLSATLKDALEKRFKPLGFVEGENIPSRGKEKPVKRTLYRITPKGKNLLKGWLGFINSY